MGIYLFTGKTLTIALVGVALIAALTIALVGIQRYVPLSAYLFLVAQRDCANSWTMAGRVTARMSLASGKLSLPA